MKEKSDKLQIQFLEEFQKRSLKSGIEALLFASGEPLTAKELSIYLEEELKIIENTIQEMIEEYDIQERGIKLISIKGSYQLVTKSENSTYIQKLLKKSKRQSLSQASLESLSIIAYQQPITRIDIDEIRGVKSESALQRLLERDLIKEVGRLEVPGRPILYGTTEEFLRQFGIKDLNQLPSLDFFEEDKSYDLERGF
ncbi:MULTISPECIES: SMC-Scp complex subunit ScpB [Clostridium]|uniref:Segregation and condensation protein B n=1 Tax=Clostridium botulinum (strain Eklund 17B / Type B) TaxID=935198 RepID=B2TQW5_CLOBB|nr:MULTISPECIES: SMC-Scp complex subunit ScpB [Clostridium]ACD22146.1 segregation and condensation protein B [Clostridium botulinum B str. Eklund 17B (NRP)]MBN1039005.1 segregation/condensation protein B [Clostridium botulinum]MBN1045874.1 segregation/condensation protein B [Clostridium botulinum]MBN1052618.1 segregation/condensation protein B [Clostridium botulinum]MBN1055785.1 segregation/condensation protein B [Clostridium botulinum]